MQSERKTEVNDKNNVASLFKRTLLVMAVQQKHPTAIS